MADLYDWNKSVLTVEPSSSALNICCWVLTSTAWCQQRTSSYQSISPACRALSSKRASHCCCCRSTGQTDGRMDDPFIGPVLHFVWAASSINGNCSTDWPADGARSNQVSRSEIASRHWVMSQLLLRRPVQMLQHSTLTVSAIWHLLYYGTEPVYLALFTRTLYRVGQKSNLLYCDRYFKG